MSQPFEAKIIAKGSQTNIDLLSAFLRDEWACMKADNTVLRGFRWVQSEPPTEVLKQVRGDVVVAEYQFQGDGTDPELYAAALAHKFPALRLALLAADASIIEWLAAVIVVQGGIAAYQRYRFGQKGFYRVRDSNRLLQALEVKAQALHNQVDEKISMEKELRS